MKYCLYKKDKLLIFQKIDHHFLIKDRDDLIKEVESNKVKSRTIHYKECIARLEYFSELPHKNNVYLTKLNFIRNNMVHFEYSYDKKEIRKLLISHIYNFINDLVLELELKLQDFLDEEYIEELEGLKKTIDDEIKHNLKLKIATSKKHYFKELTEEEREQKKSTVVYTKKRFDEEVKCPACENDALLQKKIQLTREPLETYERIRRNIILKDLSCHHCGLNITDYDQLRILFIDKEKVLRSLVSPYDCPEDCPDYDCPDDCPPDDCPEEDCPDDCPDDCPEEDCPDDCPDDCPPDDCPEEDCPDDCPPDDCPEEDCPND
jgi:predicted nucleic-acid-binding Zn-ribbon protein